MCGAITYPRGRRITPSWSDWSWEVRNSMDAGSYSARRMTASGLPPSSMCSICCIVDPSSRRSRTRRSLERTSLEVAAEAALKYFLRSRLGPAAQAAPSTPFTGRCRAALKYFLRSRVHSRPVSRAPPCQVQQQQEQHREHLQLESRGAPEVRVGEERVKRPPRAEHRNGPQHDRIAEVPKAPAQRGEGRDQP